MTIEEAKQYLADHQIPVRVNIGVLHTSPVRRLSQYDYAVTMPPIDADMALVQRALVQRSA